MVKATISHTCPDALRSFALEWQEVGQPVDQAFWTAEMDGKEAVSAVHRINRWRGVEITRFINRDFDAGIDVEAANRFFLPLLGMTWDQLERLVIRLDPGANRPAIIRRIGIYLPRVPTFTTKPHSKDPQG